jgi:O-methyltransferase domain/Dimerisation domain
MSTTPPANPLFALVQLASGLWVSRAVWTAAKLGIADAVGDDGASADEIAAPGGLNADNVRRLMNALVSIDLFRLGADGRYRHSDVSQFLKKDHPLSQRHFIESVFGGEHYAGWGAIEAPLLSGRTAFDHVYGQPVFDWYGAHPDEAQMFSRAMASTTMLIEAALLASWTPPAFDLAVDIGGSRGTLVAALLRGAPHARGILFDLPDIAESVRRQLEGERIEAVGGDFFKAVPEGDLYLLKLILHDWTNAQSVAILRNIRAAIRPGGRVAIVENVLSETPAPGDAGFLFDLNMMVMTGGRERTSAEFEALLNEAGFALESVTPTPTPMSVVQAVAA